MTEITIDKNVPAPAERRRMKQYPWREMGVGDSFFVSDRTSQQVSASAGHASKRLDYRFTCRKAEQNGVKGVRVWRID
jgi:hypothetical protein